jgi:hypothetical protein
MSNLEIVRCTVMIETTPPISQYGWIVRGVTTYYSLPFRSPGERAHFVLLLVAYVGPAVAADAIEDLGALLCLSRDSDEAAAHGALDALDRDYADLLTVTPLEEMNEMVSLLLEEVAMATERR